MLSLKKHGDILEQNYYDSIIPTFNMYEELWKIFIGNNGQAQLLFLDDSPFSEKRKLVAQYSYTIFESLVCLFRIKENKQKISTLENYIEANNNFILFQTHCGRIRDCVHKISGELKLHDLEQKLDDFYKKRNNVLHGRKLPFTIVEEYFVLPIVEGKEINPSHWKDNLRWEDIEKLQIETVSDIYEELYITMITVLNGIYSQIITYVKSNEQYQVLVDSMLNFEANDYDYYTVSGIWNNHSSADRLLGSISGSAGL